MKPNQFLAKLAALLLAAFAFPASVAFADEDTGAEPGVVDETPIEDGEVVDVGVVEDGEVMPEEWMYMTGAPVDGEEAVDDGAVVLEDGTVVTFDGMEGEEVPAEELMYYTTSAPEASVSVNAPDYVDAAGISEIQLDSAYDGDAVVQSEFDRPAGESLSAPEVPAPAEGSAARIQDGRLVSAAPASK